MKFQKPRIKKGGSRGFSFIEVMISVFLVTVGMMAIISLISGTLRNSLDSRNQIVATLLAQEGTELVRNIRDNNWIANPVRTSFVGIPTGGNCVISYDPGTLNCTPSSNSLNIDSDGFYTHSAGAASRFQRQIIITGAADRTVVSMVIWGGSVFPAAVANCNTAGKCAYTQVTLSSYGE